MEKQITAKDIHADFFGAEERLFVDAVGLTQRRLPNKDAFAQRFVKIGFGKAKAVKDYEDLLARQKQSPMLVSVIEYFRTYYPSNKFITESEVKRLCEKYGLLLGDAENYKGDMPEKNLVEIERFKLRKEDYSEKISFNWVYLPEVLGLNGISSRRRGLSRSYDRMTAAYYGLMMNTPSYAMLADPYLTEKKKNDVEREQPAFKICAPKEDFDTRGFEVRDGYILVYDPIVLQPVSFKDIQGYLIITAWGDEANDEMVVNPINS